MASVLMTVVFVPSLLSGAISYCHLPVSEDPDPSHLLPFMHLFVQLVPIFLNA